MLDYFGFELNEPGDSPWAARELANYQGIIDQLGLAVDYPNIGGDGSARMYDMIFGDRADSALGGISGIGLGFGNSDWVRCPLDIILDDSGYSGNLTAGTGVCIEGDGSAIFQILTQNAGINISQLRFGNSGGLAEGAIGYYIAWNILLLDAASALGALSLSAVGVGFVAGISASTHALDIAGSAFQTYLYQSDAAGLIQPLQVRQADLDVGFIHVRGTDANGGHLMDKEQVGHPAAQQGWVEVYITNDTGGLNIPTGSYWIPVYQ